MQLVANEARRTTKHAGYSDSSPAPHHTSLLLSSVSMRFYLVVHVNRIRALRRCPEILLCSVLL